VIESGVRISRLDGKPVDESASIWGEFETESAEATMALGKRLGAELVEDDVVLLYGELGAGKTVFAKGIASALGIDASDVTSPSFTLLHQHRGSCLMLHLDLYRVSGAIEAEQAGLLDVFCGSAIVVIEWPERIEEVFKLMSRVEVYINLPAPGHRRIAIRKRS